MGGSTVVPKFQRRHLLELQVSVQLSERAENHSHEQPEFS